MHFSCTKQNWLITANIHTCFWAKTIFHFTSSLDQGSISLGLLKLNNFQRAKPESLTIYWTHTIWFCPFCIVIFYYHCYYCMFSAMLLQYIVHFFTVFVHFNRVTLHEMHSLLHWYFSICTVYTPWRGRQCDLFVR